MLVADEFLGTIDDQDVAARVDEGALTVTLDDTERRRSRVRTATEDGTDVGIVVGRELRDGDILGAEDRLVVVSLAPIEALVLDFSGLDGGRPAATAALELGHVVGNRHWDLAVEGACAYLPTTEDRERMETEIRPHLPDGVTVATVPVSPALFDDATPDHEHSHSHGRSDDAHDHSHGDHAYGHDHDHAVRSLDPDGGEES